MLNVNSNKNDGEEVQMVRLQKALALCVAYGSSIGGIATQTGTPPNLVLKDIVNEY